MKAKHSTAFDIMITFVTKIIFLGGSFIISILLARLLGPQGKGVVTALFVIPNMMVSLADLGVRQASAYYIGQKKYSVQEILSSSLFLWILTSIGSMLIVLTYYVVPFTETYSGILILIGISYVPIKILVSYLNGVLQGQQMIGRMNVKILIEFSVRLAIVILLVWLLDLGVTGAALATVLPTAAVFFYSRKMVSQTARMKIKYYPGIPQDMFRKGVLYALALFVLQLNYKVDIVLLENLVSSTDLGIYSVGVTLAELIWQVPAAVAVVLFARSANSKSDKEASNRSAKLLRLSWIPLLVISVVFFAGAPLFVSILYGNEFVLAGGVIRLLLPGIVVMVLFKILNADLAGRGKPLFALRIYVVTLVINVILNLILIPQYGINGAAAASTVSYMTGAVIFSIAYHRYTGLAYRDLFIMNTDDVQMVKSTLGKWNRKRRRK